MVMEKLKKVQKTENAIPTKRIELKISFFRLSPKDDTNEKKIKFNLHTEYDKIKDKHFILDKSLKKNGFENENDYILWSGLEFAKCLQKNDEAIRKIKAFHNVNNMNDKVDVDEFNSRIKKRFSNYDYINIGSLSIESKPEISLSVGITFKIIGFKEFTSDFPKISEMYLRI